MKRLFAVMLMTMLIFSFAVNAFGNDLDQVVTEEDNTVDYVGVQNVGNYLSINGGIANCKYYVVLQSGYKADVTTILQKYNGSSWVEVTSWSHSKVSQVDTTKTRAVVSGYKYRIKTYANIYNSSGKYVDQVLEISNTVNH